MHPAALDYLGVPGRLVTLFLLLLALALFLWRVWQLIALLRAGKPDHRLGNLPARALAFLVYVVGQRRLFHEAALGSMHAFIFWGFLVISVGSLEMLWGGLTGGDHLPLFGDSPYLPIVLDLFRVLVMAAVVYAAYRRLVVRPSRLTLSAEGLLILGLISGLTLTDFLVEGLRLAFLQDGPWWAPVGQNLAGAFSGLSPQYRQGLYNALWWLHLSILLGFLVYIPFSKHLHILAAPFNVFLRWLGPKSALSVVDMASESLGVSSVGEFSWKHLLDLYACSECGRCQEACPAHSTGKPLSPKELILALRARLLVSGKRDGHGPVLGGTLSEESIWCCSTCGACQDRCPVFIEHVPKVVELRRRLVDEGRISTSAAHSLEALKLFGNPQRLPAAERIDCGKGHEASLAKEGEPVDMLYWVGCMGAYDPVNQQVFTALTKILKLAKVNYALLGAAEQCCGDPARRLGEEGLFQVMARQNVETIARFRPKRILTHCPHCYNVLKNEYPQFGGRYSVVHHAEFLAEIIGQGQLGFAQGPARRVAYQDPCYLGRYNEVYDAPRQVLGAMPTLELTEVARSREDGFCCGGGGGQMWLETSTGQRMNYVRFATMEAVAPQLIATSCPFCKVMLEDAANYHDAILRLRVKDIAELVYENCSLR